MTTTISAMVLCILAAISPAFPWKYQPTIDLEAARNGIQREILASTTAFADWHGTAICVAGGVGFLFLVATSSLKPVPWWRSLGITIIGICVIVFTIIYATRNWNHFPIREFGGLLAILSAVGLLFVACLEIRRMLEIHYSKPKSSSVSQNT